MSQNKLPIRKKRGRPFDEDKLKSIISTAGRLFGENGFERTTIDAISDASGVTKMSIYSHFKSKEDLFGATITSRVEEEFSIENENLNPKNPRDGLAAIAEKFLTLIRKDEVLGMYRTMFSSALTHQNLCNLFYKNGPLMVHREVAGYLYQCNDVGSIEAADCDFLATQFLSLFTGLPHIECLLGIKKPTKKEDMDLIKKNVDFFIKSITNI